MILPMVCWSNACEVGMIGTMRVSSFQSRLVNRSFYFAQELISLSNLPYRLLVGRNYFLPSIMVIETELNIHNDHIYPKAGKNVYNSHSKLKSAMVKSSKNNLLYRLDSSANVKKHYWT